MASPGDRGAPLLTFSSDHGAPSNLVVDVALMLTTVVVAHLTSTAGKGQVVQAPANETAIQRTVAR